MKLLTLNTHSWMEEHPMDQLEYLVDKIYQEHYDLVALQEVNQKINAKAVMPKNFFYELHREIPIKEDNFAYLVQQQLEKKGLVYFWTWIPIHIGYDQFDEGLAILSKTPLLTAEEILLSQGRNYLDFNTRKALKVQTKINGVTLDCYSVHFSWWKNPQGHSVFSDEWQKLSQVFIDSPTLVMGDFNNAAHVEEEGYQLVLDSEHLQDSFLSAQVTNGEHTVKKAIDGWKNNAKAIRIDYVFTSKIFQVDHYHVAFDGKNGPILSDHFGIEVTARIV